MDLRRRESAIAQRARHRDERLHILGQMRDRAVGQAAAHRRTVGPARCIHQHELAPLMRNAFVGARRGVALQMRACRVRQAFVGKELADRHHPLEPWHERAVRDQLGAALVAAEMRRERERDIEPVSRERIRGAVRPFEQHHRGVRRLVDAELGKLARMGDAIEIGVHHGEPRQHVGLHQGEGRTRHLQRGIFGEMADQRARERGLAGAEVARERDQVARLQHRRDVDGEALRRALVRERDGETGRR